MPDEDGILTKIGKKVEQVVEKVQENNKGKDNTKQKDQEKENTKQDEEKKEEKGKDAIVQKINELTSKAENCKDPQELLKISQEMGDLKNQVGQNKERQEAMKKCENKVMEKMQEMMQQQGQGGGMNMDDLCKTAGKIASNLLGEEKAKELANKYLPKEIADKMFDDKDKQQNQEKQENKNNEKQENKEEQKQKEVKNEATKSSGFQITSAGEAGEHKSSNCGKANAVATQGAAR